MRLNQNQIALTLRKVSFLHQTIVNSTALLNMLQTIDNLRYPVSLSNLVKIEQTITVNTYVKENQITFILEVPLIMSHMIIIKSTHFLLSINP